MITPHNIPPKTRSLSGHKSMKITSLITAGILGATIASQAAVITWGTATAISNVSDISTTGTLVEAINLNDGTAGTVVVNGVTFTNDGSLLSNASSVDKFSEPLVIQTMTRSCPA